MADVPKRPRSTKPGIGQKKLRARLSRSASRAEAIVADNSGVASLLRTERPGLLIPETPLERTYKIRQPALRDNVDSAVRNKASFALDLHDSNLTPYINATYSRSGRSLLLASRKGHVVISTWRDATLQAELFLNETVRDGTFLHNDSYFALAQKSYLYIYDSSGTQLHVMRKHSSPGKVAFLPYHMLLASATSSVADSPRLAYTDTSTGKLVADQSFGGKALNLGHVSSLCTNMASGVLNMAHSNGVVSLWAPCQSTPLARMFAHRGGVRHVRASADGHLLVTSGADATIRTWDVRTFRQLDDWAVPSLLTSFAVSQRNIVAASFGATVHVWSSLSPGKDITRIKQSGGSNRSHRNFGTDGSNIRPSLRSPYMVQQYPKRPITCLNFCPFEDLLAVGHETGIETMIVPGAGEATFDVSAPNPYEKAKSRREAEVRNLLDKLPPETIALDVNIIGGVDKDPGLRLAEMRKRIEKEHASQREKSLSRRRAKGRGKISKKLKRKQKNVIDAKRVELQERMKQERQKHLGKDGKVDSDEMDGVAIQPALRRFYKK